MLGPGDRVRWEDIIYAFLNAKELSVRKLKHVHVFMHIIVQM